MLLRVWWIRLVYTNIWNKYKYVSNFVYVHKFSKIYYFTVNEFIDIYFNEFKYWSYYIEIDIYINKKYALDLHLIYDSIFEHILTFIYVNIVYYIAYVVYSI